MGFGGTTEIQNWEGRRVGVPKIVFQLLLGRRHAVPPNRIIEAVSINWYIYGVIVGPESFKPTWDHELWYHRKLADGVYLWHGYK